ncbi:MAG: DUF4422 domain-containing protein [Clostridia bacterium]|nr:DUF4422 domain-containing protein [Clostridia bacterium]
MKIKLLISYHKRSKILSDDILTPIHLGRVLAREKEENSDDFKWMYDNMIGDDTGENISAKNPSFNELTAIYWAWKNYDVLGAPDYIGFMHYRRHFVFRECSKLYFETPTIDDNYFKKVNYTEQNVNDMLSACDFVTNTPHKRTSVYNHYKNAHDISELELVLELISEFYPDYTEAANTYVYGDKSYFYNMFIFPRDIFFRYAEWIFDILFKFESRLNDSSKRMFVSERLTGIFITKLLNEGYKAKSLPTMFITGKKPSLKTASNQTKANLLKQKGENSGIKAKFYAFKPIILYFTPSFIVKAYRNRKAR